MDEINFKDLCDKSLLAILVFSKKDNKAIYANSLAVKTLNLDPENPLELSIQELYPKEDRPPYRVFNSGFLQDSGFYQDLVLVKKDGQNLIANVGVKMLDQQISIMFQDVSLNKRLQREITVKQQALLQGLEEITKQNEELKSLDAAKTKFVKVTSHELRTPVSAILGITEAMQDDSFGAEERKQFSKAIYDEAKVLMKLVNNLIDLSRIDTGTIPLFIEQLDIHDLSLLQIEKLKQKAAEKLIDVQFEIPKNSLAYVDPLRFNQIFSNILDNAIQFTKINTSVSIKLENTVDDMLTISIHDQGHGIDSKNQNKIFEKFETVTEGKNHSQGTGLGLPISKKLIELMGGYLYCESEEDKGSTFYIQVPKNKILADEHYGVNPFTNSMGDE